MARKYKLPKKQMNQSYECTLHYAQVCLMCSECNCIKIMQADFFCVFWVLSNQIGYSMHVVYAYTSILREQISKQCSEKWLPIKIESVPDIHQEITLIEDVANPKRPVVV